MRQAAVFALALAHGLLATTAALQRDPSLSVPDISLVGLHKSGTSHLYRLISSHRNVRHSLRKEWCPASGEVEDIAEYAEQVSQAFSLHSDKPGFTFSSCIRTHLALNYYKYVLETASAVRTKFIYVIRDPADWRWARWNYWQYSLDKIKSPMGQWVVPGKNYRSPELFHELILAMDQGKLVDLEGSISGNLTSEEMIRLFRFDALDMFIEYAGRENVLIVLSSDLKPSNSNVFLPRLADFIGLPVSGFKPGVINSKTNTGYITAKRGPGMPAPGDEPEGIYEISDYKPMLKKTRCLIYSGLRDFCELAHTKYGVYMERCLDRRECNE